MTEYGKLLRQSSIAIAICLVAVLVCYFWIDRPIAIFVRYWPETWSNNNPSLIGDGIYGFHPFEGGDDLASSPIGHAARILSFALVWFMSTPRIRAASAVVSLAMLLSLVLMNYHFVSDVIAGGFLGGIIAAYAVHLAKLQTTPKEIYF